MTKPKDYSELPVRDFMVTFIASGTFERYRTEDVVVSATHYKGSYGGSVSFKFGNDQKQTIDKVVHITPL